MQMVIVYGVEQWRHWEVRMAPIFGAKIYKPVLPQPNCLKFSIKFPRKFHILINIFHFPCNLYFRPFRSFRFGCFVSVVSFRLFRFGRFVSVVSVVSMVSAVSFRSFRFDVSPFSTCRLEITWFRNLVRFMWPCRTPRHILQYELQ
jgi:hypothetical protein